MHRDEPRVRQATIRLGVVAILEQEQLVAVHRLKARRRAFFREQKFRVLLVFSWPCVESLGRLGRLGYTATSRFRALSCQLAIRNLGRENRSFFA